MTDFPCSSLAIKESLLERDKAMRSSILETNKDIRSIRSTLNQITSKFEASIYDPFMQSLSCREKLTFEKIIFQPSTNYMVAFQSSDRDVGSSSTKGESRTENNSQEARVMEWSEITTVQPSIRTSQEAPFRLM
jgi:hypothetical protein